MDGFNVISLDKDPNQNNPSFNTTNNSTNSPIVLDGVEIIDEEKEKEKNKPSPYESWIFFLAVFSLVAAVCYFVFLVVYRITLVDEIAAYDEQLKAVGSRIDVKEIEELKSMDETLRSINTRLKNHILLSNIMSTINANLRKNLQVSEYRLQVDQKDVTADISAVAPSFKELAEQTEKFFILKENGEIKNFSVTGLSYESNTRRLKFSVKVVFDKTKVSVGSLPQNKTEGDNNIQN